MIELKRLRLVNWHNFENVTFDCKRLTYMIGVNAVGKTTVMDAIRYCLTTNKSFNALGNKKSGRTLQGSVHAKQRGDEVYRRPGHTVAYIGTEFWDTVGRASFCIVARVESESPTQELRPGDQTWYLSEPGCTLEMLPFIDPKTNAPTEKERFQPVRGKLTYTRSQSDAKDRISRALGIGKANSALGKKFNDVFQMGTSLDEIPNFREFIYNYILPQPEVNLDALQGDRVELENLHEVLAEARTRAEMLSGIVAAGRRAAALQQDAEVNRGLVLRAQNAVDADAEELWVGRLEQENRKCARLQAEYESLKNQENEAEQEYFRAHSAAAESDEGRNLELLRGDLARKKTELDAAEKRVEKREGAQKKLGTLFELLAPYHLGVPEALRPEAIAAQPAAKQEALLAQFVRTVCGFEGKIEKIYFDARQAAASLEAAQTAAKRELEALSAGKWVYPHDDCATKVRDAVNAELSARGMEPDAKIFCELLYMLDESWQSCAEACLGDRRFDILVPAKHYFAAKSAFVALGDRVGRISLLDTPSLEKNAVKLALPAATSLAARVGSENPLAKSYANALLSGIVCCEDADGLERTRDSATRDLLRHHPYRLERLRRPQLYIGLDARRTRAQALKSELDSLHAQRAEAAVAERRHKTSYDQYQNILRGTVLDELTENWDSPLARDVCRRAYDALAAQVTEYEENPLLRSLYQEEAQRKTAWETLRGRVEDCNGSIKMSESRVGEYEQQQAAAIDTAERSAAALSEYRRRFPLLEETVEKRYAAESAKRAARDVLTAAVRSQKKCDEALQADLLNGLEPAQRAYNERYASDYPLGLAGCSHFEHQYESLVRIDLERYAASLEEAQRKCKDRFRKDILYRMKDDIFNARRQFRELNRVMEQLCYGEEVYRFELEPSSEPKLSAFYQLIVDKGNQRMTSDDSLENLAATADAAYEAQVDELMERIMADVDEASKARQEGRRPETAGLSDYVDYRTYLDYDIKITNRVSGQMGYLSRVSRDSSGGENQAPFYVAICASLLQIYEKSENSIRLVLLDEAFSKMTSDRIRPMMKLFGELQLQVVLISTVEKSTAIQPYCDITYSIVRHGDRNAIAPFVRLAAQDAGEVTE